MKKSTHFWKMEANGGVAIGISADSCDCGVSGG